MGTSDILKKLSRDCGDVKESEVLYHLLYVKVAFLTHDAFFILRVIGTALSRSHSFLTLATLLCLD
jgi:hypothetical protein